MRCLCCFDTQTVKGGLSENQRDVDVLLVWAASLYRDQANICINPALVCVADVEIPQAQPLNLPDAHFLRPYISRHLTVQMDSTYLKTNDWTPHIRCHVETSNDAPVSTVTPYLKVRTVSGR